MRSCFSVEKETVNTEKEKPVIIHEKKEETYIEKKEDPNDPLRLSFEDKNYLEEAIIRNRLTGSELEYCSHVFKEDGSTVFTWNLKDDDKEVYHCSYSFDKNRSYEKRSVVSCHLSQGYEDYKNGEGILIRDYVMPEKGDEIDMFVYPNSSDYYEKYFILGKYSDMYCYVKGDDIYFEYEWYQNTEDGPVLVYQSTAKNTDTTSGKRYHEELWDLFEISYLNIDIIPYEEYPRDKDYYDVYREWKNKEREKRKEEDLNESIENYCDLNDPEDLYYDYEGDFESYEEAEAFWHEYCD